MSVAGPSVRRALSAAAVVALGVIGLHAAQLGLEPVQTPDGVAEVQAWLGWQLWDNLRSGRALGDASVFYAPVSSLWALFGNPGAAAVVAPLHALASPRAVAATGSVAAVVLNAAGGAALGARHRAPWSGALLASTAWWWGRAEAAGAAQGLVGLGLLAAATDRRGLAVVLAALGAAVAPLPTAAVLVGAGAPGLAVLAAAGLFAPALGTWSGPGLTPADAWWVRGDAMAAVPISAWLGAAALWSVGGHPRRVAGLAAVAAVLAVQWQPVSGFMLDLPWESRTAWAGLALAALAGALPAHVATWSRTARLGWAALLVVDVVVPTARLVAPVRAPPLPPGLDALAHDPRRAQVLVLPEAVPGAGLAWVPLHRQYAARPPLPEGVERPPPPQSALRTMVSSSPVPVVLVWRGADAETLSAVASTFGAPASIDGQVAVWR